MAGTPLIDRRFRPPWRLRPLGARGAAGLSSMLLIKNNFAMMKWGFGEFLWLLRVNFALQNFVPILGTYLSLPYIWNEMPNLELGGINSQQPRGVRRSFFLQYTV